MSKYVKKCLLVLILELLLLVATNVVFRVTYHREEERGYRVEAKRIEDRLKAGEDYQNIDLKAYAHIAELGEFTPDIYIQKDYLILSARERLYYATYETQRSDSEVLWWINVVCVLIMLISFLAFLWIGKTVIRPFERIRELPYELSKGHLSVPVKEEKNKIFGRFLWGMDLLRENLEESKQEELRLQKEKKTLLLSISHDIKTPLSSIKLYAKALEADLYPEEEKKHEAYLGIQNNAKEIEKYVNQIIKASKEDFLHLQVRQEHVYLKDVLDQIDTLYRDKLEPLNTKWQLGAYDNCMLSCDGDRLVEVLQNIIENAIKYGDGGWIGVEVGEEENCKLIRIENSGEPLREEDMPHIFDSFYRGTNVRDKKGSGLGLYICRTLMQMMDGEVFAESLENGNAFTVVVRKA